MEYRGIGEPPVLSIYNQSESPLYNYKNDEILYVHRLWLAPNGCLIGVCDKDPRVKFADRWKTRKEDPPLSREPWLRVRTHLWLEFGVTIAYFYHVVVFIFECAWSNILISTKVKFESFRWNLCPNCKVGNLLLFSDSAPIDKFYFTPIDMLCYW